MINNSSILTFSGNYYNYLDPENSIINIYDVAHALSNICRYSGHCRDFYSVAEHSINVLKLLEDCPRNIRKAGLLHDSSESVMLDIVTPLKNLLPDYKKLEEIIEADMSKKLDFQYPLPLSVKWADTMMLMIEQQELMNINCGNIDYKNIEIKCYSPKQAEEKFLEEYFKLDRTEIV